MMLRVPVILANARVHALPSALQGVDTRIRGHDGGGVLP
jgi:hypothetical protein